MLVTGGAGGLGVGTVLGFLDAGAEVVAVDIDGAKIAELERSAAGRTGLRVERLDLADLDRLRRGLARLGGIDVVVNMAAIYPSKPIEDFSAEEFALVQRINVEAAVVCVQAALPHMKVRGWGRIVNIASVTVYGGWARLSPYVASKGALVALTRAWARELGPDGITVNGICPGAFPTDGEKIHPDPEGYARFVLEHQSVKRRGMPADIAAALLFLCSDDAGFITGQNLNVDGGWVMQ